MFADVTAVTADCDCCKTRRKDAGGVWGQGGQVWDDYRVSIHVINLRMFAHVGILIPWVVGNLPRGIAHTEIRFTQSLGRETRLSLKGGRIVVPYPTLPWIVVSSTLLDPPTDDGARRCNRSGRCPPALPCVGGGLTWVYVPTICVPGIYLQMYNIDLGIYVQNLQPEVHIRTNVQTLQHDDRRAPHHAPRIRRNCLKPLIMHSAAMLSATEHVCWEMFPRHGFHHRDMTCDPACVAEAHNYSN